VEENTVLRSHQPIATCFAITALGVSALAVGPDTRYEHHAFTVRSPLSTRRGAVVEITNLQPFTHIAYIPVGSNRSSIKIEGIRAVKVATKQRSVTNPLYCAQNWFEPGGSMYCPYTTDEGRVPAYQVTCSYRGQPMASDEYGNTSFMFSVYFRPDELSPSLRRVLSSGKVGWTTAAEFFTVTTTTVFFQGSPFIAVKVNPVSPRI
jgi:hypothetical protein